MGPTGLRKLYQADFVVRFLLCLATISFADLSLNADARLSLSSPQNRTQNKKEGCLWTNNRYLNRQHLNTSFKSQQNMGLHGCIY